MVVGIDNVRVCVSDVVHFVPIFLVSVQVDDQYACYAIQLSQVVSDESNVRENAEASPVILHGVVESSRQVYCPALTPSQCRLRRQTPLIQGAWALGVAT